MTPEKYETVVKGLLRLAKAQQLVIRLNTAALEQAFDMLPESENRTKIAQHLDYTNSSLTTLEELVTSIIKIAED
jgi:hypothetical protein